MNYNPGIPYKNKEGERVGKLDPSAAEEMSNAGNPQQYHVCVFALKDWLVMQSLVSSAEWNTKGLGSWEDRIAGGQPKYRFSVLRPPRDPQTREQPVASLYL